MRSFLYDCAEYYTFFAGMAQLFAFVLVSSIVSVYIALVAKDSSMKTVVVFILPIGGIVANYFWAFRYAGSGTLLRVPLFEGFFIAFAIGAMLGVLIYGICELLLANKRFRKLVGF